METLINNYKCKEWLYEQYWDRKLSLPKIALICKVHVKTIWRWMKRLGIALRSNDAVGKKIYAHIGSDNGQWKGGIKKRKDGYIFEWISKDSPYISMRAYGNYVLQHRLIMAKKLGRLLKENEVVHHINCNPQDNNIENLQIMSQSEHAHYHMKGGDYPPCQ
ncbi:MAG: HNH endonuclease [Methanomicrobia archaeon]|nr:HNH endonuclease [Methanomicrobia archaeon]